MVYMNASDGLVDSEADGRVLGPVRRQIGRARLKERVLFYSKTAPKPAAWMEENIPEGFTVYTLPHAHQQRHRARQSGNQTPHPGRFVIPQRSLAPAPSRNFYRINIARPLGGINEEPVLLADRRRSDRVLAFVGVCSMRPSTRYTIRSSLSRRYTQARRERCFHCTEVANRELA